MKRISTIFIIIFVASFTSSTGQNESAYIGNDNDTIQAWNTFIHPEYSIRFPTGWKFNQTGKYGSSFIIYIEDLPINTFKVRVSLSLVITDSIDKDLDMYVENEFNQIENDNFKTKIIESEREIDYHKIISTSKFFNIQIKKQQRVWVYKNKAYVITYTAGIDNYDYFVEKVENAIETFKITK